MRLLRIDLAKIRGLVDVALNINTRADASRSTLGPQWLVFAGRNGSGKSTLMQSVALCLVGPDAAQALTNASARGWLRHGEAQAHSCVVIHSDEEDIPERLGGDLGQRFGGTLFWTPSLHAKELPVHAMESRVPERSEGDGTQVDLARATMWRGPWQDNPRGWFVAGYGPFRRLSGHASDAQRLMALSSPVSRLVTLFREDASLVESVQWLRLLHTQRLEKRPGKAELLDVVLAFLNDGLLPDRTVVDHVDSEGLWVRRDGVTLLLEELSDGYRVVVALVLDLVKNLHDCFGGLKTDKVDGVLRITLPGVVLIDEVEAHLHVSWQQKIGFWLKAHFPRLQFLVTTHSPFVCQAADPGCLFKLAPPGSNGPSVQAVSDDTYRRVVRGNVDDAVLTDLFGLERSWSDETESKRRRLGALRVKERTSSLTRAEKSELEGLRHELDIGPSQDVANALRELSGVIANDATTPAEKVKPKRSRGK